MHLKTGPDNVGGLFGGRSHKRGAVLYDEKEAVTIKSILVQILEIPS